MTSVPVFERIIFDRKEKQVHGFTFQSYSHSAYTEHFVYREDANLDNLESKNDGEGKGFKAIGAGVVYEMFLYKNPGLQKILRFKCHNWGVQTMTSIIKKD